MQIGLGVTTGSISPNFHQGGIENTGVPTNVAIQGSGFFVVGAASNRSYTRAGDFSQDANGTLITSDGNPVQGYTAVNPATGAIITTGQPTNIVVPPGVLRAPTATTQFGAASNLDASAAVGDTFTASPQIYDCARHRARRDHHLHEHRPRRVDLLDRGARCGCHRRQSPARRSCSSRER